MQGTCRHNTQRCKSSSKRFRACQLLLYLPSHAQTLPPELRAAHSLHQGQRATCTLVPLPLCDWTHNFQREGLPCRLLAGFPGQPKGRTPLQLLESVALLFSPSGATHTETCNSFLRNKMFWITIHFGSTALRAHSPCLPFLFPASCASAAIASNICFNFSASRASKITSQTLSSE